MIKFLVVSLHHQTKTIKIMTTIQSHSVHTRVAKTLRNAGYKATCVRNEEFNDYEVKIKNVKEEEMKELHNIIFKMFNNSMINLIAC